MLTNPDKWIRKGVKLALIGTVNVYDYRLPTNVNPSEYLIISTQTKEDTDNSKCGGQWQCTVLLDLITRYASTGNTGDRLKLNDLEDLVILQMNNFVIDNFTIFDIKLESSVSFDNLTDTENVFRQLIRYRITLNEV